MKRFLGKPLTGITIGFMMILLGLLWLCVASWTRPPVSRQLATPSVSFEQIPFASQVVLSHGGNVLIGSTNGSNYYWPLCWNLEDGKLIGPPAIPATTFTAVTKIGCMY